MAKLAAPLGSDSETMEVSLGDGGIGRVSGKGFEIELPKGAENVTGPVADSKATRFNGTEGIEIVGAGDFALDRPFTFSAWVFVPTQEAAFTIASKVESEGPNKGRGWRLALGSRIVTLTLAAAGKEALARNTGNQRLEGGKWTHLVVAYDGSKQAEGIAFYFGGKRVETPRAASKGQVPRSIANVAPLRLGFDLSGGGLADVRIFDRAVNPEEAAILAGWLSVRRELAKAPGKIDPKRTPTIALIYFNRFDAVYPKAVAELGAVDEDIKDITRRSAVTHVMQDKPGVMPAARVLFRGQYDQPRDEVQAGVFSVLNPLPKEAPNNRLGLAQWIVAPDNPLTARVTVNRFWQEVFGVGLVKTAEDFGSQGEPPTHPELLDWLAVDFRESGWDVKRFFKMLVTSNTYRQAALTTPEKREKDPVNRFLSRGPRYRMDGEMIRDQALAASGLLVRKIGGASVKPYQPEGVWSRSAFSAPATRANTSTTPVRDSIAAACIGFGSGCHRRPRSKSSTPRAAKPAPSAASGPTRRCRPWSR